MQRLWGTEFPMTKVINLEIENCSQCPFAEYDHENYN